MTAQWQSSRNLQERIVVTGALTLETPTHFGNGDSDGLLDMPLHLDAVEGRALLTGSSLAGALRAYVDRHSPRLAEQLFGRVDDANQRSEESMIIIDDALGPVPHVELRDGVSIDPKTQTAHDDFKFDMELLGADTEFPLAFELMVPKGGRGGELVRGFCLALHGLAEGDIRLGKRKRRGFGRCRAGGWQVQRFDMTTPQGLVDWLNDALGRTPVEPSADRSIFDLMGVEPISLPRPVCTIDARFRLAGSLLIRSAPASDSSADAVHLRSRRNGEDVPVLSGTSVAGALRARATRIANTLGIDGENFVNKMFGYRSRHGSQGRADAGQLTASRLWVDETTITAPLNLVQTRVKIDRFTGGSYPGALLSEEAVFGATATRLWIRLALEAPPPDLNPGRAADAASTLDAQIGMMLLLLKDLWTGDLPLGGESSIGRGRLAGESATISIGDDSWTVADGDDGQLHVEATGSDKERLETYVRILAGRAAEGATA